MDTCTTALVSAELSQHHGLIPLPFVVVKGKVMGCQDCINRLEKALRKRNGNSSAREETLNQHLRLSHKSDSLSRRNNYDYPTKRNFKPASVMQRRKSA